ncbi:MAG: LPS export ABC transporter permease LptF [Pseudomonadota bacterium]
MLIDRYLIREVTVPFVLTAVALLGIFATFSVSRYLAEAVDGLIPPMAIGQLTALRALIAMEVLLPLAFYLATLMALSRLHADFEITALRASGMGEGRFLWPLLRLAALLCALIGLLSWLVRPWAYAEIYRIEHDAASAMALDRIRAGQFYQANSRSADGAQESSRAVFIETLDRTRTALTGVFVRTRTVGADGQTTIELVTAPRGVLTPYVAPDAHRLLLEQAQVQRVTAPSREATVIGQFQRFDMQLDVPMRGNNGLKLKALPGPALGRTVLDIEQPDQALQRAEQQWRIAAPLVPLVLTLLALPLARSRPRQSRFARVVIAALLYAGYYNLIGLGRSAVEQGTLPSLLPIVLAPLLAVPLLTVLRNRRPER